MRMRIGWVLVLGGLGLAGCDTGATPFIGDAHGEGVYMPGSGGGSCGADRLQGLVGQDASAANGAAFTGEFRVLYPGDAGGAMFRPQRTTVRVDDANRISKVQCG